MSARFYKITTPYITGLYKLCNGCSYKITTVHGNMVSDRCIKYMLPVKDTIVYELTSVARNDRQKCGPSGQYYQKCTPSNPHLYNPDQL